MTDAEQKKEQLKLLMAELDALRGCTELLSALPESNRERVISHLQRLFAPDVKEMLRRAFEEPFGRPHMAGTKYGIPYDGDEAVGYHPRYYPDRLRNAKMAMLRLNDPDMLFPFRRKL